jgi:hypothetical protein
VGRRLQIDLDNEGQSSLVRNDVLARELGTSLNSPAVISDFDGDGSAEVVVKSGRSLRVYHFSALGFQAAGEVLTRLDVGLISNSFDRLHAADLSGDGLPELVVLFDNGTLEAFSLSFDSRGQVAQLSRTVSIVRPQVPARDALTLGNGYFSAPAQHLFGDFNGDGRIDLATFRSVRRTGVPSQVGEVRFFSNSASGGAISLVEEDASLTDNFTAETGWYNPERRSPRLAVDLDGDGKKEIALFYNRGGVSLIAAPSGSGEFPSRYSSISATDLTWANGYFESDNSKTVVDVDGDGREEIVAFHPSGRAHVWGTPLGAQSLEGFQLRYLGTTSLGDEISGVAGRPVGISVVRDRAGVGPALGLLFGTGEVAIFRGLRSQRAVVPLHYQHEFLTSLPSNYIQQIPEAFGSLTFASFGDPGTLLQTPQRMRAQYIMTSLATEGAHLENYPVRVDAITHDEYAFLHSTDPARLAVRRSNQGGVELIWAADDRAGVRGYAVYELRNPPSTFTPHDPVSIDPSLLSRIDTAIDQESPRLLRARIESTLEGSACLLVKSIDSSGRILPYSLPFCGNPAELPGPREVSVQGVRIVDKSLPRANPPYRATRAFRVEMKVLLAPNQVPSEAVRVVPYIFQLSGPCLSDDPNLLNYHCVHGFRPAPLHSNGEPRVKVKQETWVPSGDSPDTFLYAVDLTVDDLPRMVNHVPDVRYESPVFKIYVNDASVGAPPSDREFPLGGGFYSPKANQRLHDRIWGGVLTNIRSPTYQNTFADYFLNNRFARGINTVYLDEWRPEHTVAWEFTQGWQMEAPAVELPYPAQSFDYYRDDDVFPRYRDNAVPGDPSFENPALPARDPWINSLDQFASELRRRLGTSVKLFGNGLQKFSATLGINQRALSRLDGGLMEGCFGEPAEFNNNDWLDQLASLSRYSEDNKMVVCLNRLDDQRKSIQPGRRMFVLGSFLLAHDVNRDLRYAPQEVHPKWIERVPDYQYSLINFLPEYDLDLGVPLGEATEVVSQPVNPFIRKREFSNGYVVVNGSGNSRGLSGQTVTVSVPAGMQRAIIVGSEIVYPERSGGGYMYCHPGTPPCSSDSSYRLNPGHVVLEPQTGGSVTLEPGTAAIFVVRP